MEFHLRTKKVKIVIFLLFLLCVYIFNYLFENHILVVKCPFHKYLNIYCPGCGNTRMLINFFKCKFYKSFRYNPLGFILFVIIIIFYVINIFKKIELKNKKRVLLILLCITIIYGIMRNISLFSFLAPTEI